MTRPDEAELLGFIQEKGFDLELMVAAALKRAGFTIGQSIGVTDHAARQANMLNEILKGGPAGEVPEHDGREVDIIASCAAADATVAYIVECKSLRRGVLAALELAFDDSPTAPQEVTLNGRDAEWINSDPTPVRVQHDCRAFKLVAKADKDPAAGKKEEYDPVWNALRQVLDASDDAQSLGMIKNAKLALRIPLLVVDAPLFAVHLDESGKLRSRSIGSALLRVAAHKGKTLREVSVVTFAALPEFATRAFEAAKVAAAQLGALS